MAQATSPSAALMALAAANPKDTPLGFLKALGTPFEAALDYVSSPLHAVGNLIEGDFENAGKNALNLIVPGTQFASATAGDKTLPSEALRGHGLLPDNFWASLATDIALDPVTYLTLGAGSGARGAAQASRAAAQLARDKAARTLVDEAVRIAPAGQKQAARRAAWEQMDSLAGIQLEKGVGKFKNTQAVEQQLENSWQIALDAAAKDASRAERQLIKKTGKSSFDYFGKPDVALNNLQLRLPFTTTAQNLLVNPAYAIARRAGYSGNKPIVQTAIGSKDIPRAGRVADALGPVGDAARKVAESTSPRLSMKEVDQLGMSEGMMGTWSSRLRERATAYGGYNKGVTDAVVLGGHYADVTQTLATRASSEYSKRIAEVADSKEVRQALRDEGFTGTRRAANDAVRRSITIEAELPRIVSRIREAANAGDEAARDLMFRGNGAIYETVTQHLEEVLGAKFVSRETLLRNFDDQIEEFRDALTKVNKAEMDAGIARGVIDTYVPHYMAVKAGSMNRSALRKARKAAGTTPWKIGDAGPMKSRTTNDLLEYVDAGLVPELDAAELLRLRREDSGRILGAFQSEKAIANRHGVRSDVTGRIENLEGRIAALQQREEEAWQRFQRLSERRNTTERAAAWQDVLETRRDLRVAEALRLTDGPAERQARIAAEQADATGPVDATRREAQVNQMYDRQTRPIKDAKDREQAARAMRESDDPEVRAAADELASLRAVAGERTTTVELLLQQAGAEKRLKQLEALEAKHYEQYIKATGKQLNISARKDRLAAIKEVQSLATRSQAMRAKVDEILEEDFMSSHEFDFADDAARLKKVHQQLQKVEERLAKFFDLDVESSADMWREAAKEYEYQARRVARIEETLNQVRASADTMLSRARGNMERAERRASRRIGRRQAQAQASVARAEDGAIDTLARGRARKAVFAAERLHKQVHDDSLRYVGNPSNFRAIGRQLNEIAAKVERAEKSLLKAEQDYRRSMTLPAGRTVSAGEFRRLMNDENWMRLNDRIHSEFIAVPPDIRHAADRAFKMVFGEVGKDPWAAAAWFYRATALWKKFALLSPGYLMRNGMSDMLMMYIGGFRDLESMPQAVKMLRYDSSGKIPGTSLTYEQVRMEMDAMGLRQAGFAGGDVKSTQRNPTKRLWQPSPLGQGRLASGFQKANEFRENWFRAAMYLEGRKRGLTPLESSERATKTLFDYTFVAPAIAQLRKGLVPFIVYPTKAIPFLMEQMIRQPGYFANYAALRENMMEFARDAEGNPVDWNALPTGMAGSLPLPNSDALIGSIVRFAGADAASPGDVVLFNPSAVLPTGAFNSVISSAGVGESADSDHSVADTIAGTLLGLGSTLGANMNPVVQAAFKTPALLEGSNGWDMRGFAYRATPTAPFIAELAAKAGVPVPGFEYKQSDSSPTGERPVWHPLADILAGLVPAVSQTSGYAGAIPTLIPGQPRIYSGASSNARNEVFRRFLGINVAPYDVAERLANIQKYGR
jgi:hypothetical protein